MRIVERTFEVRVSPDEAWRRLADVESWPSWAGHIKSVEVTPPGPVGPSSKGTLRLKGGMKSTFAMTEFVPPHRWEWVGPFAWLKVRYDHAFAPAGDGRTRLTWTVDVIGPGAAVLGRVFAAVYRRNLERAIPNLVAQFEG